MNQEGGYVIALGDTCNSCGWSFTTTRARLPRRSPLRQLEESARLGCPRCGLLVKAFKLSEDQLGVGLMGDDKSCVIVRCHPQGLTGVGARILWPERYDPSGLPEAWKQVGIEIFSEVCV